MNRVVIIIISLFLIIGYVPISHSDSFQQTVPIQNLLVQSETTIHSPIRITYEQNFTDYGFTGSGLSTDPYRIVDLNITSNDGGPCISVSGSVGIDVCYVIQGCIISNASIDGISNAGISLTAGNGTIKECIITNCAIGIGLGSGYKSVIGNNLENCNSSIEAEYVLTLVIQDNTVNSISLIVSSILYCDNVYIRSNSFYVVPTLNIDPGTTFLDIRNNDNVTLTNNTFKSIGYSRIKMTLFSKLIVDNCTFEGPQLHTTSVDEVNLCDSLFQNSYIYFNNIMNETLIDYNTFIDCQIDIKNYVLNCSVTNNIFDGFYRKLSESLSTERACLRIYSNSTVIANNLLESDNKTVNSNGIIVNLLTTNVTLNKNTIIHNNTITGFKNGIVVWGCDTLVTNNSILNNNVGIEVGASNCSIYYNRLIDNPTNAIELIEENSWDDSVSMGNYWDRYFTVNDRWPIYIDDDIPVIQVIEPITASLGENITLRFNASDNTPFSYSVYIDDSLTFEGMWNGSIVEIVFSPIVSGIHIVEIVFTDINGNSVTQEIIITVPELMPISLMIGIAAIVVGMVVIVGLIMSRKR